MSGATSGATSGAVSVAIVVPVHNGAALIDDCLTALADDVRSDAGSDVEILIVDDGSTDETPDRARRRGATVLVRTASGGPYAARNDGWRSTRADLVVFTDVRCRPRPGWLAALRAELERDHVAIAGGDVVASAGATAAERFVADRQALSPRHTVTDPFLPYVPTATLAIRRTTLEAVDGFREVRSGGDVDLCWRVQLAGLGQVAVAAGAVSDWVPRVTIAEVLRQWRRYGRARAELLARFEVDGATRPPVRSPAALAFGEARNLVHGLRTNPPGRWDVELTERLCAIAWGLGYRDASRTLAGGR